MNEQEYIQFVEEQKFLSPIEKGLLIQAYQIGHEQGFKDGINTANKIMTQYSKEH